MREMEQYVYQSLNEARAALDALLDDGETLRTLAAAGRQLSNTFRHGGRVFSCGNGGSMCDAMHFAEELSGRYRLHRKGLPAASISDPSHLSCVGNDYGYDRVFARYLRLMAVRAIACWPSVPAVRVPMCSPRRITQAAMGSISSR